VISSLIATHLTLGEGTGRDGEIVIDTISPFPIAPPPITQAASWKLEDAAAFGQPQVLEQRDFQVATLGSPGNAVAGSNSDTEGPEVSIATGGGGAFGLSLVLLLISRRRQH